MKKTAVLCLLLAAFRASADTVMVETMEAGGQKSGLTLKIKGDKIRSDASSGMTTITDTETGDLVVLNNAQKQYMKLSAARAMELKEAAKKAGVANASATPAAQPKIADTGRQEKVNDYNAEIYTAETPSTKFTFWVSKEVPDYEALDAQRKKLQEGLRKIGLDSQDSGPDTSQLTGVIVKTVAVIRGQMYTTTLVSVKEQALDDAEFQVPANYKQVPAPAPPPRQPAPGSAAVVFPSGAKP